jgi:hypothetical protein
MVGDNGVLSKAINAHKKTKNATLQEKIEMEVFASYNETLKKYEMDKIKENLTQNLDINDISDFSNSIINFTLDNQVFYVQDDGNVYKEITIEEAKNDEYYSNSKNSFVKDNDEKVFILPASFKVSEESVNVDSGVVIKDTYENEFVWVPVENAIATSLGEATTSKAMSLYNAATGNYSGIFYDPNFDDENNITGSTIRTTNYYEPALAIWSDTESRVLNYGYTSRENFLSTMQTEYNSMVNSVNTYKGFYIGRYETSINENEEVQSKKGALPFSGSQNWYALYEKQKNFYCSSTQSSMIWGSQYDAMVNWIITGTNANHILEIERNETTKSTCGSNENDIINNIYDLTGNTFEWTLAKGAENNARGHRGGYFGISGTAFRRSYTVSGYSGDMNGSRMTLYIK